MSDWKKLRESVQHSGRFLTRMVMPNISAFIAWGLLTACFSESGWFPNSGLSDVASPMIHYLLPLLVGVTGGRILGGDRGGVVGGIATMGVIAGTDIPMLMGAMVIGPVAGVIIRWIDRSMEHKVPMGFEMLTTNFSAGIIGFLMAIVGYKMVGPVVQVVSDAMAGGIIVLVENNLLFLVSIIIEPAKVMFLNNAINHGVLDPLGVQQVSAFGKSIFFMLETNPGPGLGILLAAWAVGRKQLKQAAPGAVVIHLFGGIHEIYFPYVLANPLLFIAVIMGGMTGVTFMNIMELGLVSTPSPGSIFAIIAMSPKTDIIQILFAITMSALVSFTIAKVIYGLEGKQELDSAEVDGTIATTEATTAKVRIIHKIVFACDTGMGSSAMGASMLSRQLQESGIKVLVEHSAIEAIPQDADMVVTYESLSQRASRYAPQAMVYGLQDFLDRQKYEALIRVISEHCEMEEEIKPMTIPTAILMESNILLGQPSVSKEEAIRQAGAILETAGYVTAGYTEGMLAREVKFTTYIGNGVAIPHGENEVKDKIQASGLVVIQYPEGIDFGDGNIAKLIIGIAGKENEHLQLLSNIAEAIEDEALLAQMCETTDTAFIHRTLVQQGGEAQ